MEVNMNIEDMRDSLKLCHEILLHPDNPVSYTVTEVDNRILEILAYWDKAHHLHQIMEEE
jgi:6-phosphogluconolactonase (cycloisomerase 2 family)|tara:strand:+ start:1970 stop:2149 length:180 start_codon:yes stop_codon:yes gene_type:complete